MKLIFEATVTYELILSEEAEERYHELCEEGNTKEDIMAQLEEEGLIDTTEATNEGEVLGDCIKFIR